MGSFLFLMLLIWVLITLLHFKGSGQSDKWMGNNVVTKVTNILLDNRDEYQGSILKIGRKKFGRGILHFEV